MPQLNREDFMARVSARIGEDNSDDALTFMRDMADTFDGLTASRPDTVSKSDFDQLQGRYDELSRSYRERFMTAPNLPPQSSGKEDEEDEAEQRAKTIKFGDLFSTKK